VTIAFNSTPMYRTSSRCTTGGCVEVAPLPGGGAVVRDTKNRAREPLTFDKQEWADFVLGVKNGEFDFESYSPAPTIDRQKPEPDEGRAKTTESASSTA
jgi:hypothetical protein